jgi:hypothetical protein
VDFIEENCCPVPSRSRENRGVLPRHSEYGIQHLLALSLWKTLCLGVGCDGLDDLREAPQHFLDLWLPLDDEAADDWARYGWSEVYQTFAIYPHLLGFREDARDVKIRRVALREFFPQKIARCKHSRGIVQQLQFFAVTASGRKLVGTSNGFLGIAPLAARHGDLVYILLGCNLPVILRGTGRGSFKLIGECYVQGLMNGESSPLADMDSYRVAC